MLAVYCLDIKKDMLDRTLQQPVAKPRPVEEDLTKKQSENQLKDPLPGVKSSCESMATAVGVAERALCQSAQLRRDLDAFLLKQTAAAE